MTHRFAAWIGFSALALAVACEGQLFNIRVSQESSTTVPAATPLEVLIGDLGFGDFVALDLTESSELQNQGVEPGDIADVRLVLFDLEATDPDGADLSFLQSLEVYVEAPGLPDVLIASLDDFPEGQARVSMNLEDVDLTDYVVSKSMTLTTDVEGSRPDQATEVTASFALRVGVTGQGACNYIQGEGE